MGWRFFIGVAVAALFLTAAVSDARTVRVDAAWRSCMAAPTRACVAARALAMVRGEAGVARAVSLKRVLTAAAALSLPETVVLARKAEAMASATRDEYVRDSMWLEITTAYAAAHDLSSAMMTEQRLTSRASRSEAVVQMAIELGRLRTSDAVTLLRIHRATYNDTDAWLRAAWGLRTIAVRRGDEGELLSLLRDAKAKRPADWSLYGNAIDHPAHYVEPLLIVLAEQAAQGKVQEALATARAVADDVERRILIVSIAAVLSQAGRIEEVLEIALTVPAEEPRFVLAVTRWPEMLGYVADDPALKIARPAGSTFAASMALAARLTLDGARDSAYVLIAWANAREDAVANAVQAAGLIKAPSSLRFALSHVAEAQARVGQRAASIATFARVRELIALEPEFLDQDPKWAWREALLSSLAEAQAKAGQIDEALAVARSLKGGDTSAVFTTKDGRDVTLDLNRRMALRAIARAMAKAGRVEEALATARSVEMAGLGPMDSGLGIVAEGLADAGRIDDALRVLKEVPEVDRRDHVLTYILADRLKVGLTAEADKLLAAFADGDQRVLWMARVAIVELQAGNKAYAFTLVKQALPMADRMRNAHEAIDVLCAAMRGLAA
ncbi:MAG: hypothetical protein SGI91_21135 [Alphaproteobacteria bacterium]|nr:hypothetical protein [Alphaproteobacteria bacterium]